MTDKPQYVCFDCGAPYRTPEQQKRESVVTAHMAICPLCNEYKSVTAIRHFNFLEKNFEKHSILR